MTLRALYLGFFLTSFAATATAQVTVIESPGNLEPTQDPGCIPVEAAGLELTPPDLMLGMEDCVKRKDYETTARLFVLMQMRAIFDTKRVTDTTAHQAVAVLRYNFLGSLRQKQTDGFSAALEVILVEGSAEKAALCNALLALGAPDYEPHYMIQHGIHAFTGGDEASLVAGFKPAPAWKATLTEALKCSF